MKLLTDELRRHLPPLYSQEAEAERWFTPNSSCRNGMELYVTEGGEQEGDFLFFASWSPGERVRLLPAIGARVVTNPSGSTWSATWRSRSRLTDVVPAPDL